MFKTILKSLARKVARRITRKYPFQVDQFKLEKEGIIDFANWKNPLGIHKTLVQEEIDFFRKFALPGSFCIDIGANIGDTTVPMAVAAGKSGLVLAFEPNPMVFEILQVNAGLNPEKTTIITVPYAITENSGEFYYSSSEASFGNGGVSASIKEAGKHGRFQLNAKITGVNLPDYLNEHYKDELHRLSFIKIDVEGHDKDIIRSISSLIDIYRPVLIAECFDKSTADERLELFSVVADHNYSLYYFYDFDDRTEVRQLYKEDMISQKNFNFYAIPTEALKNFAVSGMNHAGSKNSQSA